MKILFYFFILIFFSILLLLRSIALVLLVVLELRQVFHLFSPLHFLNLIFVQLNDIFLICQCFSILQVRLSTVLRHRSILQVHLRYFKFIVG